MNHQEGMSIANKLAGEGYDVTLHLDNGQRTYGQNEKPSADVTVRLSSNLDLDDVIRIRDEIIEKFGHPVSWEDGHHLAIEEKVRL